MTAHVKTGSLGLLISFLGSLPIGTLNLTAFYIASRQSVDDAIWFALAVVIVELIVVRLTLWGDRRLNFRHRALKYLLPVGVLLLIYLALSAFNHNTGVLAPDHPNSLFPAVRSTFLLGLLLSVLNPMHIPFWMSWNKVLSSRNSLSNGWKSYTYYISGIGLGSMFGLLLFIFAGQYVFQNYSQYDQIVNIVLGLLYSGFAIYLFVIFYKHLNGK